jgi:ADP-ribosylglycohydrolase
MLGAIVGDVVGSVYEFNNYRGLDFPLFSPKSTFTDDSVLTFATAKVLLDGLDYAAAYQDFARRYPNRGYGGFFFTVGFTQRTRSPITALATFRHAISPEVLCI